MNIGNITSNNFNLDSNGKDMQIEVYEQLLEQLQQENKQLKDNWNEIKNIIKDMVSVGYTNKHREYYWPTKENSEYGTRAKILLGKMEELEQGSDSNVKD